MVLAAINVYVLIGVLFAGSLVVDVFVVVFVLLRKQQQRRAMELNEYVVSLGEDPVVSPEAASYRGADRVYGHVKGNGVICLTAKRLIFAKLLSGRFEIPVAQVSRVELATWFRGSARLGRQALVLTLADGNHVGFIVRNPEQWKKALATVRAGAARL